MSHMQGTKVSSLYRGTHVSVLAIFAGLLFLLMPQGSWAAVEPGSATEAVKETIDQVLRVLGDDQLKKPERAEDRVKAIEKAIGQRFDYEEMGSGRLASNGRN